MEGCELLRQIVKQLLFVEQWELEQKKGFTLCLESLKFFIKILEQNEGRQRSKEIGTEIVNL